MKCLLHIDHNLNMGLHSCIYLMMTFMVWNKSILIVTWVTLSKLGETYDNDINQFLVRILVTMFKISSIDTYFTDTVTDTDTDTDTGTGEIVRNNYY